MDRTRGKLFFRNLTLFIISLSLLATPASAEDSWFAEDSVELGKLGLVWVEDELRNGNPASLLQWYDAAGNSGICQSTSDSKCASSRNLGARVILPPCAENFKGPCVNGLKIRNSKGELIVAKLVRLIDAFTFRGSDEFKLPSGSSVGIWQAEGAENSGGTDLYTAAAKLEYRVDVQNKSSVLLDFQASVVPIRLQAGDFQKMQPVDIANPWQATRTNWVWGHHIGNCAWQELGLCAVAQQWHSGAEVELDLQLPKAVTGWLYGRMTMPRIEVTSLDSSLNKVVIQARPVTVQGSKPLVDFNNIPEKLKSFLTDGGKSPFPQGAGYANGGWVWQIPTSHENNFKWFEEWFQFTSDRADGVVDYWNIKSIPVTTLSNECIKSESELVGLVTSNALLYSGSPPEFRDNELVYEVASVHFLPDGTTPFLGSYDLVLRSTAARCLYKLTERPISAKVEIVNSDGNIQVATTTLREAQGWVNVSANGFTYSKPTIRVTFEESPLPTPQIPTTTVETLPKNAKKQFILCTKGKVTKKVLASKKAKCPKGYKLTSRP